MGPLPNNQGVPATTPKDAVEPDLVRDPSDVFEKLAAPPAPEPKKQETYKRPEQPLGRTPRNPFESFLNFGVGAMQAVGGLVSAGVDIGRNPEAWAKELGRIVSTRKAKSELYDGGKDIAQQAIAQFVDPFRGDDGHFSLHHAILEDPAGSLNAIYMIKNGLGGLTKGVGRGMSGVSRLGLSEAEQAVLGKMSVPDRLVQAGEAMENFKPFAATGKYLATKTPLKVPLDYFGIAPPTEEGQRVPSMIAAIRTQEAQREYSIAEALAKHRLTPEEITQYDNLVDLGRAEDHAKASPNVKAAFKTYNEKLRIPSEEDYEGLLTPEQKWTARAQQAAYRVYGDMSSEHVKEMSERMKLPEGNPERIDPTYRHMATKKGEWLQGADKILKSTFGAQETSPGNVHGTVGPLEARVGGGDYITNPLEAAMVQNRVNTQFRIRQRIMREIPEYLAERGLARGVAKKAEVGPGEEIAPIPFWEKYDRTSARAASVAISRKLQGMGDQTAMGEALSHILADPEMKAGIDAAKHIILPRWAARRLAYELGFPGIFGRTYDKVERLWKAQATVFRAAYWNNVAAGNGVLAALHGPGIEDAMRSVRLRDELPAEMKGAKQFVTPYQNKFSRIYNVVASKLGQFDQGLHHTQVHNPIYFKELEDGRRATLASTQALSKAGKSYFLSQEVMNDPDLYAKTAALGHDQWQTAIGQKAKLQEQFARNSFQMRELQKEHDLQVRRYEKTAAQFGRAEAAKPSATTGEFTAGPPAAESPREVYPEGPPGPKLKGGVASHEIPGAPPAAEVPAEIYPEGGRRAKKTGAARPPFEAGPPAAEKPFDPYGWSYEVREAPPEAGSPRGEFTAGPQGPEKPWDPYGYESGRPTTAKGHELIKKMSEANQAALELESRLGELKAEALEKAARAGMVREGLPELERLRAISEKAIEPLNLFGGDYGRLHPFERTFIRRAVPFWAWQKAMTKLAFALPTMYPAKTFLWNRFGRMMWDAATDDQHPEYLRGSVPIFALSDGDTLYSRPFWNPLERTNTTDIGQVPVPNIMDIWNQNNWIKVAMDLRGGYNQFTMKPWDTPVDGVRLDTGEMYRLDPSGRATKTLFQPPLLRALYGLFPWSQYVDHLLAPATQTSRGWIGQQDPRRNPDGTVAHPTTVLQRFRDILTPLRQTNFAEADRGELLRQIKIIEGYEKQIPGERDPERRQAMLTILKDYVEMWSHRRAKSAGRK